MEITLLLEYSERSQLRAWLNMVNMDRYKDLEDRGLMHQPEDVHYGATCKLDGTGC